jgi:hypothetical protein
MPQKTPTDCYTVAVRLADLRLGVAMPEIAQAWLEAADHIEQSGDIERDCSTTSK